MTVIVTKFEKNIGKVAFLIVYACVAFWFLVNGEGLFTQWGTSWTFNATIYILGVTLFISVLEQCLPELPAELKTSVSRTLFNFSIASIGTLVVLLILQDFDIFFHNTSPMPYHQILANMTFHLVIVACSEEIIFRGVLFGYLYDHFKLRSDKRYGWLVPYFGSAAVFAVFHYAVYGLDHVSLGIIFVMGFVFAYVVERWGIGASIGIHWIWNCMAIGVFVLPEVIF